MNLRTLKYSLIGDKDMKLLHFDVIRRQLSRLTWEQLVDLKVKQGTMQTSVDGREKKFLPFTKNISGMYCSGYYSWVYVGNNFKLWRMERNEVCEREMNAARNWANFNTWTWKLLRKRAGCCGGQGVRNLVRLNCRKFRLQISNFLLYHLALLCYII